MKAYTDIEQSKKLAEILPVESADMKFPYFGDGQYGTIALFGEPIEFSGSKDIPTWSLAALLELMPPYLFEFERGIDLNIYPNLNGKAWHCSYMPNAVENMKNDKFKQITSGNNLIDAVFQMICWLKENNTF